ncbi:MAG: transcriptional repressor [Oscillospiraceae bacterium]|jgi:Fe2+ or Zn2+ uptake regulation protein|nr:transcriptional repressor [Oscillospiraceae bacterium]
MAAHANVTEMLHNAGLDASKPRKAILSYMLEHYGHHTADQIYGALAGQMPTLSRMTVYNVLRALAAGGLIRDVRIESDSMLYDAEIQDHGHFKCGGCGKLFNFLMPQEAFTCDMLEGFEITQRDLFFRGTCPDCQRKRR